MRVIVADDHLLVRRGIARTLADGGCEVRDEVGDVAALLRAVTLERPDAVVIDVRLPPTFTDEGLRAAEQLRVREPGLGILVLSTYREPAFVERLLSGEVRGMGYLLKDRVLDATDLVDALARVVRGECVVDAEIVQDLLTARTDSESFGMLTGREREVLASIAEGRTNAGIAAALGISIRTVEVHVERVFDKLGLAEHAHANRRVQAAIAYLADPAR